MADFNNPTPISPPIPPPPTLPSPSTFPSFSPPSPSSLPHSSPPTLTATSTKYFLDYPLPPGFSRKSLLHNFSIQYSSCPDTALPSLTTFFLYYSTMSILHWNIRGLRSHRNDLRYLLSIYEPRVICLHWFNHPHQSLTTILLILFLSILRHHILTSTLILLFLVLCYESSFNVGLSL